VLVVQAVAVLKEIGLLVLEILQLLPPPKEIMVVKVVQALHQHRLVVVEVELVLLELLQQGLLVVMVEMDQ
jgi:hypothetical protein